MMRTRTRSRGRLFAGVIACLVALCAAPLDGQVRAAYQYTLSNFAGRLPYDWARVTVDQGRDETYVIYGNVIRVFSPSGMEVFSFGDDLALGQIADIAVDGTGDIIILSYERSRPLVTHCNFRGVPIGAIDIRQLPAALEFGPNRMVYRDGLLYFAALSRGTVIVTDATGKFRDHIDLFSMLEADEKQRAEAEISGFSVDTDGNIFFTVPVLFKAYKLSRDGVLTSFGRPGSTPGRFGIVAGIASDSRGNVFVADKLKCVIIAFDKNFNFLTEFGRRGSRPDNLITPDDVSVDSRDRLYVTQGRRRGISVFALTE